MIINGRDAERMYNRHHLRLRRTRIISMVAAIVMSGFIWFGIIYAIVGITRGGVC